MKPEYGQIEIALQEQFPDLSPTIKTTDYDRRLRLTVQLGGKSVMILTPETADYRLQDYRVWLHRFSAQLKDLSG